jgi:iron(III) transport system ATP-binding protein
MKKAKPSVAANGASSWGKRGTAGAIFAGNMVFDDVCFEAGGRAILDHVSFSLAPGEITCLLGPSGCGKTTLLRIAAGVSWPSRGRVLLDGKEMSGPKRFIPPEKRSVGLMFQDFALFPHMTVLQNVAYGLTALTPGEAREVAMRALERVGLSRYAERYPHALSGGEQQRVALARAIVPRPQIVLMDEPFSGLDQRLRESVRRETLALLREMRATCMLVTHDPVEAMDMADRIFLMRQGRLVQSGTPENIFNSPRDEDVARFFSDCNEFRVVVKGGHVKTPLGSFPTPKGAEGQAATVMIRPQSIRLARGKEGIEGFVSEVRFLGDSTRCLVTLAGEEQLVSILLRGRTQVTRGQTARFHIEAADVLIFTNGAGGAI